MKRDADLQNRVIAAVQSVESVSAIEIVVTLSPRAVSATVPTLAAALAVGAVSLTGYLLFFPAATAATTALNTLFFTALAALLTGSLPPLQRLLLPAKYLQTAALAAAQTEFARREIHGTRDRTGLLLYLSAFERQGLLVVDSGIRTLIPASDMARLEQAAAAILEKSAPDPALTRFFDLLRQIAGRYLPKNADDRNELADGLRSP